MKKDRKSRFKSAAEDPRSNTNTTVPVVPTTVHMAHMMMVLTVHLVVHMVLRADLGWIDVR